MVVFLLVSVTSVSLMPRILDCLEYNYLRGFIGGIVHCLVNCVTNKIKTFICILFSSFIIFKYMSSFYT